ncbi:MAG TPA: XdhC family protein [Alphaproteobacteria bacterium]|nr:XdhC family protein [Alphaproteobacteria bacterium]
MKRETLQQLLVDRAAKRVVVLATELESGDERLLYPADTDDADDLTEAARRAARGDKSGIAELADGRKVFLHVFNPPLRMLIVGAVHIAQPLSRMAVLAGYDVGIIDPRQSFATEERFPGVSLVDDWPDDALRALDPDRRTAIVTLTHDPKLDDPALIQALRSDVFYIGALGSTRTHARRLERLSGEGFSDADFARIHGPIGLDIGAKSPAEIAVSIMAEVTMTLRGGPKKARAEAGQAA